MNVLMRTTPAMSSSSAGVSALPEEAGTNASVAASNTMNGIEKR